MIIEKMKEKNIKTKKQLSLKKFDNIINIQIIILEKIVTGNKNKINNEISKETIIDIMNAIKEDG